MLFQPKIISAKLKSLGPNAPALKVYVMSDRISAGKMGQITKGERLSRR